MKEFDVIVIGGGPGGYSAAISAAKEGLKTALFENTHLGGTCLNEGCIPTKYLAEKAEAMERVRELVKSEIFKEPGYFSFRKIQEGKQAVSDKLVGGVKLLLDKAGVQIVNGEARLEHGRRVCCEGQEYAAKNIIIATGAKPIMLNLPGCEHCIDSTQALALKSLPESMVVVGGGVIGLEMAAAFASYGTKVEIIELAEQLIPGGQPEAVKYILASMTKRGIRLHTGAKLQRVEKGEKSLKAVYEKEGSESIAEAELVLMAIGRSANLSGIDAVSLGLELDSDGFIRTDKHMRTSLEGVYAIGDVAGGIQLASVAYAEADTAVTSILGKDEAEGTALVPNCIHTIPCYASVGLSSVEAAEQGFQPVLGSFAYGANGMALAEDAQGNVYVVMDRETKKTLGITIAGSNASEMISFAAQAVASGLTLAQWEKMVVNHPSLSEMLREAALAAFGKSVHKA